MANPQLAVSVLSAAIRKAGFKVLTPSGAKEYEEGFKPLPKAGTLVKVFTSASDMVALRALQIPEVLAAVRDEKDIDCETDEGLAEINLWQLIDELGHFPNEAELKAFARGKADVEAALLAAVPRVAGKALRIAVGTKEGQDKLLALLSA